MQIVVNDFKTRQVSEILKGITVIGNMASQLPTDFEHCKAVEEGLPVLK